MFYSDRLIGMNSEVIVLLIRAVNAVLYISHELFLLARETPQFKLICGSFFSECLTSLNVCASFPTPIHSLFLKRPTKSIQPNLKLENGAFFPKPAGATRFAIQYNILVGRSSN